MKAGSRQTAIGSKNTKTKPVSQVFVLLCLLSAVFLPADLSAQQSKKFPRIGYLSGASASVDKSRSEAFRQGLREVGYVEGHNIGVEYRHADGKFERLRDLANELVHLKVDLLVVQSTPVARAAKSITETIPIVFVVTGDPVENALVQSLARPGGNATGIAQGVEEFGGKWLELLRDAVPKMNNAAVLRNPDFPVALAFETHQQRAAEALRLPLNIVRVRRLEEMDGAFAAMSKDHTGGLVVDPTVFFSSHYRRVVGLASKYRLPAIYGSRRFVDAGGLMSYADNDTERMRRAAIYVDKILKGTKPADLPVQRASKFEFLINLNAAKRIGLAIPPNVLARADKVIR